MTPVGAGGVNGAPGFGVRGVCGASAFVGRIGCGYRPPVTETASEPERAYIASLTRVRAAAGVLLTDEQGRVLVVHTVYGRGYELPGGLLDVDESPMEACVRELREELGFAPPLAGLLCVDWVPPAPPWDGGLMFLFDGGVLSPLQIAEIRLQPTEIDRFEFVEASRLEMVLVPRLARRALACLKHRELGGIYLEDGVPVMM